jgi:excisionase family DNA binding protein
MAEMLSAKEMQTLLQVDRSTIYRMAEAGQLPAIKVGKQWRFPGNRVESWLKNKAALPSPTLPEPNGFNGHLADMLPLDCVQLIQDAFAEALGVMLVITDLAGRPITQVSQPCPVYSLLVQTDSGAEVCREQWQALGQTPALEPRFVAGLGGVLAARALVRLGNELKGMVIASGVAPQDWPPPFPATAELAHAFQVDSEKLQSALAAIAVLNPTEQKRILLTMQRIADILAHISAERLSLLERLDQIAKLSSV